METSPRTDRCAELIAAAAAPYSASEAVLDGLGPAAVAEVLLTEMVDRARALTGPMEKVDVQVDLGHAGKRLRYVLTTGPQTCDFREGTADDALVGFRQDLGELLRAVYAPGRHDGTQELTVRDSDSPHGLEADDKWLRRRREAVRAARLVIDTVSRRFADLSELAVVFDADKWGGHWYTPHYQRYLEPFRDKQVRVLEIGVGGYDDPAIGGSSLRMWKHYFWRGQVIGMDIHAKHGVDEARLCTVRGDQGDATFLGAFARDYGPFDVIVDDGSHFSVDVRTSFATLFDHLRPGGVYIVEDLQSSYWPGWGGSVDPDARTTSMAMVKSLLDGLNHQEMIERTSPAPTDTQVRGVHVHHNIAVVEKGMNTEAGAPAWVPREVDPRKFYAAR